MALPPGLTPKVVTVGIASFFDGSLAEGTVTITAPTNVIHKPTNRPIFSSKMSKRFVDGEASFNLCPTDAEGLNNKSWTYKMNVVVQGALVQPDPIYFVLPEAGPDEIDLDSLVTVPSSAGIPVSVAVLTAEDLDGYAAQYIGDADSATRAALQALELGGDKITPEAVEANLPARLSEVQLSAAYVPSGRGRIRGLSVVGFGDSYVQGGDDAANNIHGNSILTAACMLSQGRLQLLRNSGVGGQTTAQILARYATDLKAYAPRKALIVMGTNDAIQGVPFDTTKANYTEVLNRCAADGIEPVVCTIAPYNGANTTIRTAIAKINRFIRREARQRGITCVEIHNTVVDPASATGNFRAGYSSDGVHLTNLRMRDIGRLVADALLNDGAPPTPFLVGYNADPTNLIANGCFLDLSAWARYGAGVTTETAVADAVNVQCGNWFQSVRTDTGQRVLEQIISTGFAAGDLLEFSGLISTEGYDASAARCTVRVRFTGGSPNYLTSFGTSADITPRGLFWGEARVPAGTTGLAVQVIGETAAGTHRVAQMSLANLTQLGVA